MSSKVKYNYELLKLFCQANKLKIVDNLNNSDICCNTIIQDKCINNNCNNYFNKKFIKLLKTWTSSGNIVSADDKPIFNAHTTIPPFVLISVPTPTDGKTPL